MRRASLLALITFLALPVHAQDLPPGHPPTTPEAHAEAPLAEGDAPPPAPPEAGEASVEDPHAGHGHAPGAGHGGGGHGEGMDAVISRAFGDPVVAVAGPTQTVPPGSIRITVTLPDGQPLRNSEVALGIMRQGGDRERTPGQTDENGVFTYANLPTGQGQAYRVNVPYEGATYSCTPFQLPTDTGYDVRIEARPVTHEDRSLLLVLGQTMVELRDNRFHVIQQARLSNLGEQTYVFPEDGTRIPLPEGYTAFQTQAVMTDQRVEEVAGEGLRIRGSLPTGQVTLAWAFDLPVTGTEMMIPIANPFHTFQYRVISTAQREMHLEVEGMPPAMRFEDQGQPLYGTEMQRSPEDEPFTEVRIRMHAIPGPGPARWIGSGVALVFVVGALAMLLRRGWNDGGKRSLAERKAQILADVKTLEEEFAKGEIGEVYRQTQKDQLVRELSRILYQEERLGVATVTSDAPTRATVKANTAKTKTA